MRITNLNPGEDIGASAWFVEMDGGRLLLDAGIHPKREGTQALPSYDLIGRQELDAVAVSHGHHDHAGSLPVVLRRFPRAHVLMTELSYFLIERVLHNSVNVMTRQREELGIRDYPLYTHDEVDEQASRFQGFRYNREVEWGAFHRARAGWLSPALEFFDAGHALGSAGIMVRSKRETLFYTGDVCFHDQTILKRARFEDVRADVLIMETTRGNRSVSTPFRREAEVDRLAAAMQGVLKRKGSILIPAFALGRTQEILALLALWMHSGQLRRQRVYVGGLGRVFTEIYDLEAHRTHRQNTHLMLTEALELVVLEKGQAEALKLGGGQVFVITAGMMTENTAAHDLAVRLAGDERHAIFVVGYMDPDTPGGRLSVSQLGQPFAFSRQVGELTRRCELEHFDLTAHADRGDLLDFVGVVSPQAVVLAHGSKDSQDWFEAQIRSRYPRLRVFRPGPGQGVEL
jgi:Cft2 family RNA processing exonuclease